MADRLFAGALLLVAIAYTSIAFTTIKAPFQYDPLGPESWPRLLGLLACACLLFVVVRPDIASVRVERRTLRRLAAVVLFLLLYAQLYQPLGFVFATWLFCSAMALLLGAGLRRALLFGAAVGVIGFVLGTVLLDLNLPGGLIEPLL